MEKTWASGSIELLNHAKEHMKLDSAFDKRIAFISLDNAVELMIKTYLTLPKRFFADAKPTQKEINECNNSFTSYLDLLNKYVDVKLIGIDVGDIECYHRKRNILYHDGAGLSIDQEYLSAYFIISNLLLKRLFNCELEIKSRIKKEDLSKIIHNWNTIEELLIEIVDVSYFSEKGMDVNKLSSKDVDANRFFSRIKELYQQRNQLVHSQAIDNLMLQQTYIESEQIILLLKKYIDVNKDEIKLRNFFYEPSVSEIKGTISLRQFYGLPMYFSEDEREEVPYNILLLDLEQSINIHQNQKELEEGDSNHTQYNISSIQLVVDNYYDFIKDYINKKVRIKGRFYGANTAHHFTPILLIVDKIDIIN